MKMTKSKSDAEEKVKIKERQNYENHKKGLFSTITSLAQDHDNLDKVVKAVITGTKIPKMGTAKIAWKCQC